MSLRLLAALILKDLRLFFANRFFALITLLGLVAYTGLYYLMPRTIGETLELGLAAPRLAAAHTDELAEEGLVIRRFDTEAALRNAVSEGRVPVGIVLPADLMTVLAAGGEVQAQVLISADVPPELQDFYPMMVEEWVALMIGSPLSLEVREEVLGIDRAGEPIPPRDRMLPLFAVFVLMMETLGLASLITSEIVGGTIRAILSTPLRVEGLFLGKGLTGVGLAFTESALLMALTGGLAAGPLPILVTLLLGATLVTGIAFLLASVARDMMSVMAWGILALVLLVIPALNVMIPGLASDWIRILPTYYLVEPVYRLLNYDMGWSEVSGHLLTLAAFALAFFGLGVVVLRRRFR